MSILNLKKKEEKEPEKILAPFSKENIRIQKIVSAIILQSKNLGVNSFIYGFKDIESNKLMTHLQDIKISDAVNIHYFGWINSIQTELKMHPEYSKEYKKIFTDAIEEFNEITKKINKKVEKFNAVKKK